MPITVRIGTPEQTVDAIAKIAKEQLDKDQIFALIKRLEADAQSIDLLRDLAEHFCDVYQGETGSLEGLILE